MNKPVVVKFSDVTKTYSMFKKKSDKLLEIFSLKQGVGSFSALSNISFEVYKGETIGIIGINGSGKSTLSSLLAQVTPPTSGNIWIDGEPSLVSISAGLNNFLTGMENIELKCMMHGLTKKEIEEIKPDIIEFADIGEFIHQPIKSYSSGMKSRLGFAISAHIQPDILVVDEALSVGDSTFYQKCLDKFDEFKREGKTIFFISHSLSQVQAISDRIMWLNFGRIKMFGEKDKVASEYTKFINWFNDLSKAEQRKYRNKMLATQKNDFYKMNKPIDLDIDEEFYLPQRRLKSKNKKNRTGLFLQFILLFILFLAGAVSLFVENPVEAITGKFDEKRENVVEPELVEQVVTINKDGMVQKKVTSLYQDKKLTVSNDELLFAEEVFVEEEIDESVLKVSLDDGSTGYVKSEDVTLTAENDLIPLDYTIEQFLPLFPDVFSESYEFLIAFLNVEYQSVKESLYGLTDEYEDEFSNKVLVFNDAYSYFFDNENVSYAIEVQNINIEYPFVNELIENAHLVSDDGKMLYLVLNNYKVVIDVEEEQILLKLLN